MAFLAFPPSGRVRRKRTQPSLGGFARAQRRLSHSTVIFPPSGKRKLGAFLTRDFQRTFHVPQFPYHQYSRDSDQHHSEDQQLKPAQPETCMRLSHSGNPDGIPVQSASRHLAGEAHAFAQLS
ncbi:hypothetical protein SAMN05216275_12897 [Streptosporangium canum]|uniref:Uncharacterized protein n=1 Tax=Streptosporangium canum TaxID=324952 RepID=A0A1I4AJP8_9ACTN|nr:hypothetical protein SAMN05216275_12897 [Streptosporangium canum]